MIAILLILSILLIIVSLLQSGKAVSASSALTACNDRLFSIRTEIGVELFMSRLTFCLGLAFYVVCIIMNYL